VLVDAPCSGLGTLRRNPDLKWRQTRTAIDELTPKQASILASAARLVKKGGRLVYATCSLLEAENEAIVTQFLADHPDFALVSAKDVLAEQRIDLDTGDYLSLWPHRHGTDGFFAAVLERRGAASGSPFAAPAPPMPCRSPPCTSPRGAAPMRDCCPIPISPGSPFPASPPATTA
jgi:16S rRNA (cytosine967-C5)-methyltransferase